MQRFANVERIRREVAFVAVSLRLKKLSEIDFHDSTPRGNAACNRHANIVITRPATGIPNLVSPRVELPCQCWLISEGMGLVFHAPQ